MDPDDLLINRLSRCKRKFTRRNRESSMQEWLASWSREGMESP